MSKMFDEYLIGHIIHTGAELREMDTAMLEAVTEEFRCVVVCCNAKLIRCTSKFHTNGEDVAHLSWLMGEYARYMGHVEQRRITDEASKVWEFIVELCKLNDPEYAAALYAENETYAPPYKDRWIASRILDMKNFLESEEWQRRDSYDEYFEIVNHWRDGFYAVDHETQHWLLMAWAKNLWPNRIR